MINRHFHIPRLHITIFFFRVRRRIGRMVAPSWFNCRSGVVADEMRRSPGWRSLPRDALAPRRLPRASILPAEWRLQVVGSTLGSGWSRERVQVSRGRRGEPRSTRRVGAKVASGRRSRRSRRRPPGRPCAPGSRPFRRRAAPGHAGCGWSGARGARPIWSGSASRHRSRAGARSSPPPRSRRRRPGTTARTRSGWDGATPAALPPGRDVSCATTPRPWPAFWSRRPSPRRPRKAGAGFNADPASGVSTVRFLVYVREAILIGLRAWKSAPPSLTEKRERAGCSKPVDGLVGSRATIPVAGMALILGVGRVMSEARALADRIGAGDAPSSKGPRLTPR